MKLLIIISFAFVITSSDCHRLTKRQSNLKDIQALIQELEKQNANNVNKESNTPVRDALGRLFGAFQEMSKAYIGVLTSVGKSVGMPLPTIGHQVEFYRERIDADSIFIKQINENLRQLQSSINRVTNSITDLFNRPPAESNVLIGEASKFIRLWSHQLQDLFSQFNQAISQAG